jgi:hypothetical protein
VVVVVVVVVVLLPSGLSTVLLDLLTVTCSPLLEDVGEPEGFPAWSSGWSVVVVVEVLVVEPSGLVVLVVVVKTVRRVPLDVVTVSAGP